jgi:16S rRNA (guanine527-N7)-methyltransferase
MFHVKHEGLAFEAARLGVTLRPEQEGQLLEFEALLAEHAAKRGMMAAGDIPRLRERHLLDSLRASRAVRASDRDAFDLGSGAGLPGIVVAIACPQLSLRLIESRRTRTAFLELVASELGLANVRVMLGRVDSVVGDRADLCFARAFADLRTSWRAAESLLRPSGRLIYFAGQRFSSASDVPDGVRWDTLPEAPVARAGRLVIMSRQ